jgi:nucleotide-binding universal stress UspA family protein
MPAKPSLKRILVPLDGSALGEAALPHAEELAKMAGAEIILVHVVSPQHYEITLAESLSSHLSRLSQEYAEHATAVARDYLGLVAKRLAYNGIAAQVVVELGPPSEKILACARERLVDLIALSTHGRSGVGLLVMGSVANKVVHSAEIPVLLVKPNR